MARHRTVLALAGFTLALSPVIGCSGGDSSTSDQPARADTVTDSPAKDTRMIIDVRTPADFVSRIGELERSGSYVVYCRSGNRSGMAMAQMLDMGFTDVSNAGSVEEASASLGISIVG